MRGAFAVLGVALLMGCISGCTSRTAEPAPDATPDHGGSGRSVPAKTSETAETTGATVTSPAPSAEDEQPYEHPPVPPAPSFYCRKGAFCDDFEGAFPIALWTERFAVGNASTSLASISATSGAHSLEVTSNDATSAGYLRFAGKTVGTDWAGVAQFAFRASSLPVTSLAGPAIAVIREGGDPVSIGVVLDEDGLVLVQREGQAVVARSVLAPARADHWFRVTIGFEASAPRAGGVRFGRVETTVDDGDLLSHDLRVPAASGGLEFFAGVTRGDTSPSTAQVDDVSFFVF